MNQGQRLLKQLEQASGRTQLVVAQVFDVRGFTNFCKSEDSFNIANFVRRIYIRAIGEYFPDATYYKPTGDGMLIVFSCSAGKEVEITKSVVERSMKFVKEFHGLCKGDALVYFKTPPYIGVGISRGAACCISSGAEILDFSGKPLNLASRLSDMARPFGVVVDESVSSCIPTTELEKDFRNEKVYVKGIAEGEPITVYLTKETTIPSSYKKPLNEPEWITDFSTITIKQLLSFTTSRIGRDLSKTPIDENDIKVEFSFPEGDSTCVLSWPMRGTQPEISWGKTGKEYDVSIDKNYLLKWLKMHKVQPETPIKFSIIYPAKT